jgi:hypothetical protein
MGASHPPVWTSHCTSRTWWECSPSFLAEIVLVRRVPWASTDAQHMAHGGEPKSPCRTNPVPKCGSHPALRLWSLRLCSNLSQFLRHIVQFLLPPPPRPATRQQAETGPSGAQRPQKKWNSPFCTFALAPFVAPNISHPCTRKIDSCTNFSCLYYLLNFGYCIHSLSA